ncbi:MAG: dTMP kinase [Candidatus Ancillula sp.]|jgi:dTMP kinase|nr:dTMP kinase [Candidatus Ancillula sp.]
MFITFEGIDGSGKTTQIAKLREFLGNFFPEREVVVSKEPGGTPIGARIRQEILHGDDIDKRTELLLYLADRAEHVAKLIKPALDRGAIVISDRYSDSTICYQSAGRKLDEDVIMTCNEFSSHGLTPDLTVLLDIEAHISKNRVESSGEKKDRLESSKIDFFERTREKFLELSEGETVAEGGRWLVLSGDDDVDIIADRVAKAVNCMLTHQKVEV